MSALAHAIREVAAVPGDWFPIDTAPRDGTLVRLTADNYPIEMYARWQATEPNLIMGTLGTWAEDGDGSTWSEGLGTGPTHWGVA